MVYLFSLMAAAGNPHLGDSPLTDYHVSADEMKHYIRIFSKFEKNEFPHKIMDLLEYCFDCVQFSQYFDYMF